MKRAWVLIASIASACTAPGAQTPSHDIVIRHGTVYDGTDVAGILEDVAIDGDRITAIGVGGARGHQEVDATGLAVAPGFIDMLNHSETAFMADGRAQSGIRQGVTLAVFGESSMGPLSAQIKQDMPRRQGDIKFDITWSTLDEGLETLVKRGVSINIASFVSASTIRAKEVGLDNRPPTPAELDRMRDDVRVAMREGAMGLTTALIYTPAVFSKTDELVALAKIASESGGMYIAHIRSEGDRLLEAIDETIDIARQASIPAEIYHLKASAQSNLGKMTQAIAKNRCGAQSGTEDHRRYVHIHGRIDGPRCRNATVGTRRRLRRVGEAAARSAGPCSSAARHDDTGRELGEPDAWRWRRRNAARRLQERSAARLHWQDAR